MITGLTTLVPETAARRRGWSIGYTASYVCHGGMRHAPKNLRRVLGADAKLRRGAQ